METVTGKTDESLLKDRTVQVAPAQKEYKYLGYMTKQRGHILFEYDRKTREVNKAIFKVEKTVRYDGSANSTQKIIINQDCFYIQALNKKNAIKKLIKMGFNPRI